MVRMWMNPPHLPIACAMIMTLLVCSDGRVHTKQGKLVDKIKILSNDRSKVHAHAGVRPSQPFFASEFSRHVKGDTETRNITHTDVLDSTHFLENDLREDFREINNLSNNSFSEIMDYVFEFKISQLKKSVQNARKMINLLRVEEIGDLANAGVSKIMDYMFENRIDELQQSVKETGNMIKFLENYKTLHPNDVNREDLQSDD
jgi:hypothetical protein